MKFQELAIGEGPAVQSGEIAVIDYVRALSSPRLTQLYCDPLSRTRRLSSAQVLRRSNGYFIYSTVEGVSYQPRSVPTGPYSFCVVRMAGMQLCSSCTTRCQHPDSSQAETLPEAPPLCSRLLKLESCYAVAGQA